MCFRSSVHYARDAAVAFKGRRYVSALIACQHSWEMAGKAALGVEGGYAWPPPPKTWMTRHSVFSDVIKSCGRLVLPPRIRRTLNRLESWLPPGASHANPPLNTEYIFDAGAAWAIPSQYFNRSRAQTAIRGIIETLELVKGAYRIELKHLSSSVPNI